MALARVIELDGSGPRLPGAAMAVTGESEVAGSVSGGCVEGAVVGEALEVLVTGEGRMVTFGYSDRMSDRSAASVVSWAVDGGGIRTET